MELKQIVRTVIIKYKNVAHKNEHKALQLFGWNGDIFTSYIP